MNQSDRRDPLIVISGPTAVGKSDLAAELGRRIRGEVVSADSMQVYRYMDIGSAKVTLEEMLGVPHHMIDVLDPREEMDAARYASMAKECISGILERGHVPILCGGTGFYIQAVVRDIDFTETNADEEFRARMRGLAEKEGPDAVHALLLEKDPEAAAAIHPNNLKRVIRALEYAGETGRRISEHNAEERKKESPYLTVWFYIDDDRETLYRRIDKRVDFMIEEGLMDEVAYLRAMGLDRNCVSMQGIGYKEMLDALDGVVSVDEAVRLIKRNSRHYAKRQGTWFRREKEAIRLDCREYPDSSALLAEMIRIIEERTWITAEEPGKLYE